MEHKDLIVGLKFAVTHELTKKEMEVLILFLEKSLTTAQIAEILGDNPNTLHHTIQRLKLKRMLILENRDSIGNYLYKFNDKLLM